MEPSVFLEWFIVALSAYRLQRVVTSDTWPPSEWFRSRLAARVDSTALAFKTAYENSDEPGILRLARANKRARNLHDFFTCPWCLGFWITVAVVLEHHHVAGLPLVVHVVFAASTLVGLLGSRDD